MWETAWPWMWRGYRGFQRCIWKASLSPGWSTGNVYVLEKTWTRAGTCCAGSWKEKQTVKRSHKLTSVKECERYTSDLLTLSHLWVTGSHWSHWYHKVHSQTCPCLPGVCPGRPAGFGRRRHPAGVWVPALPAVRLAKQRAGEKRIHQ